MLGLLLLEWWACQLLLLMTERLQLTNFGCALELKLPSCWSSHSLCLRVVWLPEKGGLDACESLA
jgi:hypothetical protein